MKHDFMVTIARSARAPNAGPASPVMETALLAHRRELLAFFAARDRRGSAEDLLQEMWIALPREGTQIDSPIAYLYRMANSLIIRQYHKDVQGMKRDRAWSEATGPSSPECSEQPDAARIIEGRQMAATALAAVEGQGERVFRIFYRHCVDGLAQSAIAIEAGVSIGTVENDLRRARRVLAALRDHVDDSLSRI